mgnify:CR=1 FL=1
MSVIATTRLSARGEIVIPEEVRERLGLSPGAQFVVVGDVVVLKLITQPDLDELGDLLAEARAQARRAGLKHSDVTNAIRGVRDRK